MNSCILNRTDWIQIWNLTIKNNSLNKTILRIHIIIIHNYIINKLKYKREFTWLFPRHPRTEVLSLESWQRWQRIDVGSPPSSSSCVVLQSSLQELAFFLSKVGTLTAPFLFALIGSRISLQNPQNGAVRTRPKIRFFINPLGRIYEPLERLFNFQFLVLSGSPRSENKYFRSDEIRSSGCTQPLGRNFHLFWFSLFCCSGLDSGLGFSHFYDLKI